MVMVMVMSKRLRVVEWSSHMYPWNMYGKIHPTRRYTLPENLPINAVDRMCISLGLDNTYVHRTTNSSSLCGTYSDFEYNINNIIAVPRPSASRDTTESHSRCSSIRSGVVESLALSLPLYTLRREKLQPLVAGQSYHTP